MFASDRFMKDLLAPLAIKSSCDRLTLAKTLPRIVELSGVSVTPR